jgi:predicted nucleic acid-binding protein
VILDSNVVIALFQSDQNAMSERLAEWQASQSVYINIVVYAEVAPGFVSSHGLKASLDRLGVQIADITLDEAHRAGRAFAEYRHGGGMRDAILADFLIGAQAALRGWPLVTRDRKGFASYFPEVEIIDPYEGLS